MSSDPAPDVERIFRALSDPNRRAILGIVREGPRPVGEIAESAGLSQQTASHHLQVLQEAGLAVGTRSGTRHLFAIRSDGLVAARAFLDDFWPVRLEALKASVESITRDRDV